MRPDGKTEKMHHYMGAFSETVHVYGRALEASFLHGLPAHFFSLGLGLGYNEILSVVLAVKYKQQPLIWSFESVENLRLQFSKWILQDNPDEDFAKTYDQILTKMCDHYGVSQKTVRSELKNLLEAKRLLLLEGFHSKYSFGEQKFSVILYDAFSDKINPELWDMQALEHTLSHATYESCVFSTYASKGRLKRALKDHHFELQDIRGYGSKRECTIALRFHHKSVEGSHLNETSGGY